MTEITYCPGCQNPKGDCTCLAEYLESTFPKCSRCGEQVMVTGGTRPGDTVVCTKCNHD